MIKQKFHINSLQTVLLLAVIDIEARCTMWYDKIQSDHPITHKCKLTNNELCNLQSALMQRYPHAINNLEQYPNRHYTLNISFSRKKAAWSLLVQINFVFRFGTPNKKSWVWLEILTATAVVTGDAAEPLGVLQS